MAKHETEQVRATEGIRERLTRLKELDTDRKDLVSALVDAPQEQRAELIAQHAALGAEYDALHAEMAELKERRDRADMAEAQSALQEAERRATQARDDRATASRVLNEAEKALRAWRNNEGRQAATDAPLQRRQKLEYAVTDAQAALEMATVKSDKAAAEWRRASAQVEDVRERMQD